MNNNNKNRITGTTLVNRRPDASAALPLAALTILAALTTAFLAGCGGRPAPPPTSVTVALFDVSSSTNKPAVRQLYRTSFGTVVAAMSGGDRLRSYAVTGDTQATSMLRASMDFPFYNPLEDNQDQTKRKLAKARQDALSETDAMLRRVPPARPTDLLHAFSDAGSIFAEAPDAAAPVKELLVCSDMVHEAGHDDFFYENLTDARDAQIISRLRASGELPSLKGVRVIVVGAGADPIGLIGPDKLAQIKRFWQSYFAACGATLAPGDYGTALPDDATTGL